MRIACFGGIYNNYLALEAAVADALNRGVDDMFCLGDMGAFGPHPDRVFPILDEQQVKCVQGNYDDSIGNGLDDCQCGYTDPRDNYFAEISYRYTLDKTSDSNRQFLRKLPKERWLEIDQKRILFCHGSPRKTNEFLWESTTSAHFLDSILRQYDAHVIAATHSGLKWIRQLPEDRYFVNVGVLGRPENDGRTNVWYTLIEYHNRQFHFEFVPIEYDFVKLASEMKAEALPKEFIETVVSGWWTTCLEILPSKERRCGIF